MKQTAVDWLVNELRKLSHNKNYHLGMGDIRITQGMLDDLSEQTKEMEKEQIIHAYGQGVADEVGEIVDATKDAEQYYNQTYKSK